MKPPRHISVCLMVMLMMTVLGYASTLRQVSTGQYVTDIVITPWSKAALFDSSAFESSEISVRTLRIMSQESGFLTTHPDIKKAAKAEKT